MTDLQNSKSEQVHNNNIVAPARRSLSLALILILIISNIILIALLIGLLVFGRNPDLEKHHRLAILIVSFPGIGFGLVGIAFAVAQFLKRQREAESDRHSTP